MSQEEEFYETSDPHSPYDHNRDIHRPDGRCIAKVKGKDEAEAMVKGLNEFYDNDE
jgi:hypothetical protein